MHPTTRTLLIIAAVVCGLILLTNGFVGLPFCGTGIFFGAVGTLVSLATSLAGAVLGAVFGLVGLGLGLLGILTPLLLLASPLIAFAVIIGLLARASTR